MNSCRNSLSSYVSDQSSEASLQMDGAPSAGAANTGLFVPSKFSPGSERAVFWLREAGRRCGRFDQRRELRCGMSLSESDLGLIGRIVKPHVKSGDDELRAQIKELRDRLMGKSQALRVSKRG